MPNQCWICPFSPSSWRQQQPSVYKAVYTAQMRAMTKALFPKSWVGLEVKATGSRLLQPLLQVRGKLNYLSAALASRMKEPELAFTDCCPCPQNWQSTQMCSPLGWIPCLFLTKAKQVKAQVHETLASSFASTKSSCWSTAKSNCWSTECYKMRKIFGVMSKNRNKKQTLQSCDSFRLPFSLSFEAQRLTTMQVSFLPVVMW